MPRGKGKHRRAPIPAASNVDAAPFPRMDHRVDPRRPNDRVAVLSYYETPSPLERHLRHLGEAVDRNRAELGLLFAEEFREWMEQALPMVEGVKTSCLTVHGCARDLDEADAMIRWVRSQDHRYNALDFALQQVGAPMVTPLGRMAGQSAERRYHEGNRELQRMWDDRRAQLAQEAEEMRERIRTAATEGGDLQLVGASPEGELLDEKIRVERPTPPEPLALPAPEPTGSPPESTPEPAEPAEPAPASPDAPPEEPTEEPTDV